jgi:Rrf2 family iron-sulfur cluster assembly transcriptional regulator
MNISNQAKYALQAILDIALRQDKGATTLESISHRVHISMSTLEKLFRKLKKQHLIESVRGPGGGYRLSRKTSLITVADIIFAIENHEEIKVDESTSQEASITINLFNSINLITQEKLSSTTIKDLRINILN